MCEYISHVQAQNDMIAGGPGLDGYDFQADTYCADCAWKILNEKDGDFPLTEMDYRDSEQVPQPVFFGESWAAEHCADCGNYLYGPNIESGREAYEYKTSNAE